MEIHRHTFSWEDDDSQKVFWNFRQRTVADVQSDVYKILRLFPLPESARILDVGCGLGLHVAEFGKRGFKVVGIEVSDYSVSQSITVCKDLPNCTILKMRGSEIQWIEEFDLIIALEHVLGFMDQKEVTKHIRKIWDSLAPGGTFLLGLAGGTLESWQSRYPVHKWEEVNGKYILTDKSLTKEGLKKEKTIIIDLPLNRVDEYVEEQQYYTLHEFRGMLSSAGIKQVHVFKDLDGNLTKSATNSRFFVAKKSK